MSPDVNDYCKQLIDFAKKDTNYEDFLEYIDLTEDEVNKLLSTEENVKLSTIGRMFSYYDRYGSMFNTRANLLLEYLDGERKKF